MDKQYKSLKQTIDASGFPLQIALENEVRREDTIHQWKVLAHEHPWSNPATQEKGFIDIILGHNEKRIIIECKLRKEDNWIFLVPNNAKFSQTTGRFYLTQISEAGYPQTKCIDENLSYPLLESEFCITRKGAGENLEDIASKLILSIECLLDEELKIHQKLNDKDSFLYFPAIVTASKLFICSFDPKKISLDDGTMDEHSADIKSVPYIKFTKSLTTNLTQDANPRKIMDTNKNRKRTVFIINSNHISDFLNKI